MNKDQGLKTPGSWVLRTECPFGTEEMSIAHNLPYL